eukprot:7870267-Alexandrium_andersonii.AAC.1
MSQGQARWPCGLRRWTANKHTECAQGPCTSPSWPSARSDAACPTSGRLQSQNANCPPLAHPSRPTCRPRLPRLPRQQMPQTLTVLAAAGPAAAPRPRCRCCRGRCELPLRLLPPPLPLSATRRRRRRLPERRHRRAKCQQGQRGR